MSTLLLKNLNGHWKYQQTIYNMNSEKINCHINNFVLQTSDLKKAEYNTLNKINNVIQYSNNSFSIILSTQKPLNFEHLKNNIYKNYQDNHIEYYCSENTPNNLNIKYTKNNIVYFENINLINENFFVSKMFIQKNHKYFAVIFTSYIKIIDNTL